MGSYQLFPPLDAATEEALTESIKRFGVLVPVVVDQNGEILDGHHRSRIANALGIEYDVTRREVADDDEAREIARTLNMDRRQLDREQRREVVAHLWREGHSQRAIAGALGMSRGAIEYDIKSVKSGGLTKPTDRVTGTDGKSYPAVRKHPWRDDVVHVEQEQPCNPERRVYTPKKADGERVVAGILVQLRTIRDLEQTYDFSSVAISTSDLSELTLGIRALKHIRDLLTGGNQDD